MSLEEVISHEKMKIKIMAYNILTGFYAEPPPYKHEPERQRAAQQLVKEENPDILILTEANFIGNNQYNLHQNYQELFDYPHFASGTDNPLYSWGIAFLSKFPILEADNYSIKNKRFLRTKIKVRKQNLHIDAINPAPSQNTELERVQRIKNVIRDRKTPYILAGDFNALSPQDRYDKKMLLPFFKAHKSTQEDLQKAERIVNEILTCQTINYLLEQGLIDTYRVRNQTQEHTYPTALYKDAHLRIDYIFCSPDVKVIDAGIIKNSVTEKASDHYPVYAVIEVE